MPTMPARTVVIVAFPGVQSLDVTGPLEVFHTAARIAGGGYDVRVATLDGDTVPASSGLRLAGDLALADVGAIDTLIVAGGDGTRPHRADPRLVDWLRERAPDARRVASVCSGAFLLAEAGLLDGRRVTSHWAVCRELARRYPAIDVDPEPIYTRDGDLWTSAGVTAGMDLALAIVEEDLGRGVALGVARGLVLFLRRPGGQSQFSAQLASQFAERDAIRDLQQWMLDHPEGDLSVEAMAERVAMSPRHFARRFRAEVGRDAGPLRRARTRRGRPSPPRGQRGAHRRRRARVRVRDHRDHAPRLRARPRRRAGRVPPPLPVPSPRPLTRGAHPMQIAVLLYDRFTALDAVGPYDVLGRIPGAELTFVATEPGPVRTEQGTLAMTADAPLREYPHPDIVVVPGGYGTRDLFDDEAVLGWLREAHAHSTWTTSVCTGSLLLAAAGILDGVEATTHWLARDELAALGAVPVPDRVVQRGKIMTAAGVSSGIDMALHLVARECGDVVAQAIQLGIEYDPQPPFDAGSPETAPDEIVALVRGLGVQNA